MVKSGGSKKKNVSKADKRRWMINSGIIIALLVAFFGFLAWFFYVGSPKEIVAVADQFKPDPSWELVSEKIQPPATLCLDAVECPSISKRWKTPKTLTQSDFSKILHDSNWDFTIEGNCSLTDPNRYGDSIEVCSASGLIGKYKVSLGVSQSNPAEKSWVGLSIREEKK